MLSFHKRSHSSHIFHNNRKVLSNPQIILILLIFSAILSLIYGYFHLFFSSYPLMLVKMSSIICLAAVIKLSDLPDKTFSTLLMLAVIFHSIGDFTIEYYGIIYYSMTFFLIGHLLYILVVLRDNLISHRKNKYRSGHQSNLFILVFKLFLISLGCFLLVYINKILLLNINSNNYSLESYLIIIYSILLLLLFSVAIFHNKNITLVLGVLFYISSDILIAYNDIVHNIELKTLLTWPFYYLAQIFIIFSLIKYQVEQVNRRLL